MKKTQRSIIDTSEIMIEILCLGKPMTKITFIYYTHVKSQNVQLNIQERQSIANEIYKGLSCLNEENVDKPSLICSKNPEVQQCVTARKNYQGQL